MDADFDYDKFLKEVMSIPPRDEPRWIPCRSVEEAEAFAAWCVENGIEEPKIALVSSMELELKRERLN